MLLLIYRPHPVLDDTRQFDLDRGPRLAECRALLLDGGATVRLAIADALFQGVLRCGFQKQLELRLMIVWSFLGVLRCNKLH